jgi:23S rRNA pseudouridine1911/1915/1917 synthase
MKNIIITKEKSIQRIDKFLKEEIFFNDKITRGEIIRQIKEGNVIVSGKKIKPSYILKENDRLEINLEKNNTTLVPNKDIKLEIIFRDDDIIIINKPAGLQVHPVKSLRSVKLRNGVSDNGASPDSTLVNGLLYYFPEIKNVGEDPLRPGIVHRLDKDTSGIMVIARNQKAFLELKKKFKNRKVEKKYWAIVFGKVDKKSGVIDKPLARATSYRKQVVAGKKTKTRIREAITRYKVLKARDNFSLLEVMPKTGRTHQIRVHLTSIGHPIVGDRMYKMKKIKMPEAPRQMLHAKSIKFKLGNRECFFEAKLPKDFKESLNLTKQREKARINKNQERAI